MLDKIQNSLYYRGYIVNATTKDTEFLGFLAKREPRKVKGGAKKQRLSHFYQQNAERVLRSKRLRMTPLRVARYRFFGIGAESRARSFCVNLGGTAEIFSSLCFLHRDFFILEVLCQR